VNMFEPPYPLILDGLERGKVIPFLGSGASLSGRAKDAQWSKDSRFLPTASELAYYLASMAKLPGDELLDLTRVAQYFKIVRGLAVLYHVLHNVFDKDYPIPALHRFIADIPVPLLIVTTNYDDLIERAYKEKGRSYDLVVQTSDPHDELPIMWRPHDNPEPIMIAPNELDIDLNSTTVIYKIHGSVNRYDASRDR
jgi:hypothetical protein